MYNPFKVLVKDNSHISFIPSSPIVNILQCLLCHSFIFFLFFLNSLKISCRCDG